MSIPKELTGYGWEETFTHYKGNPTAAPPDNPINTSAYSREDVAEVIACQDGDNDGPDWVAIGRLKDGRYFTIRAGCDYTGWG